MTSHQLQCQLRRQELLLQNADANLNCVTRLVINSIIAARLGKIAATVNDTATVRVSLASMK